MSELGLNIDLSLLEEGVSEQHYVLNDTFFKGLAQDVILGGNVEADVRMLTHGEETQLTLSLRGKVSVPCDRCLEPVEMDVEAEDEVTLRLADRSDEDDNAIYVNRREPVFDLGWLLYEETETALPIVCRHQEGECNPQMEELLQAHLCTTEEQ